MADFIEVDCGSRKIPNEVVLALLVLLMRLILAFTKVEDCLPPLHLPPNLDYCSSLH